ncbi:chain-length determining protein [Salinicola halophilus]|uniref:chain-length determining protein n=1 Tax=Salinicola halophilus TaxID=184065 RepID=UPI000DA205F3|nr:chain-length determining protein [Salinicola halophilus]
MTQTAPAASAPHRWLDFAKRQIHWTICLLLIVIVSFYWAVWASDRYVSHAHVILESPQISTPELSFSSILSGGGGKNSADMLLLRDYMLSTDMLHFLEENADFREHYANNGDVFSRLNDESAPTEKLLDYYHNMVSIELDEYAGVLRVDVNAFTPEKANQIANLILQQGERHMNDMGQRLAQEQVKFLEQQVNVLEERFEETRQALLTFENENGLASPTTTVESLSTVVAKLEGELASLKAQRAAMASYQSQSSAQMVSLQSQITALENQIDEEKSRLAAQSGDALNAVSSKYQTLQLRAQFAQEAYSGTLAALENTRVEAARQLKQLSVLQSPTMPEYPEKPERFYMIAVFAVIALFATLILNMLILIVKDHKD